MELERDQLKLKLDHSYRMMALLAKVLCWDVAHSPTRGGMSLAYVNTESRSLVGGRPDPLPAAAEGELAGHLHAPHAGRLG